MDVPQLLHPFSFTPNRKIVIARLPETRRTNRLQIAGSDLLQHLNRDRKSLAFWFADEEMYMLGHDHVRCDVAAVPITYSFKFTLKDFSRGNRIEERHPAIATECEEV